MVDEDARNGLAVQVLGSGGPMHADGRGNAAYLLWLEGRPLLALDMGGDTPSKLGAAGVVAGDVPLLLISHVHPDHVSGLPDFFWGEITAERSKPLTIVGPPSAPDFHDGEGLFKKLFSKEGAFPDMSDLLLGEPFHTAFVTAAVDGRISYIDDTLSVASMSVDHGDVPALAFRVQVGGVSIVFAGDQTMDDPDFARFAKGADLLVAHAVATEKAKFQPLGRTVATPMAIGSMAEKAAVGRLVLGHWLSAPKSASNGDLYSLSDLDGVLSAIKQLFSGETIVATDLDLYALLSSPLSARGVSDPFDGLKQKGEQY